VASTCPVLQDERVTLRAWRESDCDVLVAACNDPVLREQLNVPAPYSTADAAAYVVLCADGWAAGDQFTFAVTDRATSEVLGSVRVGASPGGATAGYWTAGWARGRGVATAALQLVTVWALARGLRPIRLYVSPANRGSQRVAAKAGYRRTDDDTIVDPEGAEGDFVYITPSD
jgi:RimJ/RimL family protein N-acetyltransferase